MDANNQIAEPGQHELSEEVPAVPEFERPFVKKDSEHDFRDAIDNSFHDFFLSGGCQYPPTHTVEPSATQRQTVAIDIGCGHVKGRDSIASLVADGRDDFMPKPYEPPVFNWLGYTSGDGAWWNNFVPSSFNPPPNAPDELGYGASNIGRAIDALDGEVQPSLHQNCEDARIAVPGVPIVTKPVPQFGQLNTLSHNSSLEESSSSGIRASPMTQRRGSKREKYGCISCRFSHIPCKGQEGSKCAACNKNYHNLREISLRLPKPAINHIEVGPIKLGDVAFFEIDEVHKLLVKMRAEIDSISSASEKETLEALFNGNLICNIADGNVNPYSAARSAVPIAISELSTTSTARRKTKALHVTPALNAQQLDSFIDAKAPPGVFAKLREFDIKILKCALRLAYYFGILFNWTRNTILYDAMDMDRYAWEIRGRGLVLAKNLVLETLYSIVHRIGCLIRQLFRWVVQSLTQDTNAALDPATISCALSILYSSVNKFRKLDWSNIHVQELRKFLDKLRDRSKIALTSVQHYNWIVGYRCCGQRSEHLTKFVDLVEKAKIQSFLVTLAYERCHETPFLLSLHGLGTSPLCQLSYVEVLEQRHSWIDQLGNEAISNDGDVSRWLTRSLAYESGLKFDDVEYFSSTPDQGCLDEQALLALTEEPETLNTKAITEQEGR